MAIDKAAIIDAVYQGAGQDAKNLIPPTMWSYDESTPADVYDPEKAKEMLAAAGVTELTTDLWAIPSRVPTTRMAVQRVAELIQADWAKVGVTATSSPTNGPSTAPAASSRTARVRFMIGWNRRQWRSGQLLCHLFLVLGHRREQLFELVQRGVRGPIQDGQEDLRPGRARRALHQGPGNLQGRGAGDHPGPQPRVHAHEQEGAQLQDEPARHHIFKGVDVAE